MSECDGLNEDGGSDVDRRAFLGAGAATAAALLGPSGTARGQETPAANPKAKTELIPKRALGKTGVEVSMLNLGTWKSVGLDRILRLSWQRGLRYIDTAASYGSEPGIGRWMKDNPGVRKDLFLVTKVHPHTPRELIAKLDDSLKALQTDYVDLIFIHALGDGGVDREIEWPRSREFKETAEAIRKSGKAQLVGFSCHHPRQAEILESAAQGGFVDAIMVRNNPWLAQEAPMSKALDACVKAGIGLISMKQIAGNMNIAEIAAKLPDLKEKGLSPYQGLLHAIWTDERFASVCVSMRNTDQVRENTDAARSYKPMTRAEIDRLRDACLAAGPTFCATCDGSCSQAAGTRAELGTLTRLLTYHDHHGYRSEARRQYAALAPEIRDWSDADLQAAREACPNKLDFAALLARVEEKLA